METQESLFGEEETKEDTGQSMAMSKQKIFETTGIDIRNQGKTEGGRKIWDPELQEQVLKALDEGKVDFAWLKTHIGCYSSQVSTWREQRSGGGSASPKRFKPAANGHEDDEEDIAAHKSKIKSHASEIAAAKLAKRKAARAKDNGHYMEPNNLSFQASSVANAIRLLELMRDSEDVSMVSISLSVAE